MQLILRHHRQQKVAVMVVVRAKVGVFFWYFLAALIRGFGVVFMWVYDVLGRT